MTVSRTLRGALAAAALVSAAACSNSPSGPSTITDPAGTVRDLLAIDSAFNTAQFNALTALAGVFPAAAAVAPLTPVVQAFRATLPPAPGRLMGQTLSRTLPRRDLGALAQLAGPSQVPVIPDTLLGVTFVWDSVSLKYVKSNLSGAPSNGVRFVLYDTTATGVPDAKAPIGTLDIIDKAPATGAQLEFLVLGSTGAPTYLDYTLTLLAGANGYTVNAVGFVSNGLAGPLQRKFSFNAAITHTDVTNGVSESADISYSVNVPNISVTLHLADDSVNTTNILSADYRLKRGDENIRLQGADTTTSGVSNGQFTVTVNSHLYATAEIVNGNGTIKDRNGTVVPLNGTDQHYEDDVFIALLFGGVVQSVAILVVILAVPSVLLGFTFGLL